MFDIGWTEIAIIAVVAIIVIGPKDLPYVLRTLGQWVGKAKALTREFRGHIDDLIRESELDEVKRQIEMAEETDVAGMIENSIDPDHEIRQVMESGGEELTDPLDLEKDREKDEESDFNPVSDWDNSKGEPRDGPGGEPRDEPGGDAPARALAEKSET